MKELKKKYGPITQYGISRKDIDEINRNYLGFIWTITGDFIIPGFKLSEATGFVVSSIGHEFEDLKFTI